MLKSTLLTGIASAVAIATCQGAGLEAPAPETIISLERAALDRWGKGDPQGYVELFAPEVTYFDPHVPKRTDGLAAMEELLARIAGKFTIPSYELIEPKVQHRGDVALLTFNLLNRDAAGKVTERWNSTEVYCLIGGKWKIIHSHWSYTTPEKKPSGPE